MRCATIILASLLCAGDGFADEAGMVSRLARWASPELRATIQEIAVTKLELEKLPRISGRPSSGRLGIHSSALPSEQDTFAVQIDLGGAYPVESVALIPVGISATGSLDNGYGFPRRFRLEGSRDVDFRQPVILFSQETEDFENPGGHPVLLNCGGTIVHYLRLTISRHSQSAGQWQTALGELLVLSGGRNVALGRPVSVVRGREVSFPDAWQVGNLTDGHSLLGPPVASGASPANGHLSANADSTNDSKWVQVDLGRSYRADEIHLIPARPIDAADSPGMGFPVRFQVLAGYDPTFREHQIVFDCTHQDFANPGENPVLLAAGRNQFRYLRLLAHRLWENEQTRVLALAEIQIFTDGNNLAQGAKVTASDRFTGERWAPEYLTDGYSSRHPLMDWQEHLRGLDQRRILERRLRALKQRQEMLESEVLGTLLWVGLSLFAILLAALIWFRIRGRREAERVAHRIRQQIASDLHDDVGSNLGSIALLAETGIARAGETDLSAEKFREIVATAQETASAMRDIVWMLQAGNSNTAELQRRMVSAARAAGQGIELELSDPGICASHPLPLGFTRNVFLLCKEALNNARRHAHANKLSVEIAIERRELRFSVKDDGIGFDSDTQPAGNGLANLRDRAGSIGGHLKIQSAAGQGTLIELRVDLPN